MTGINLHDLNILKVGKFKKATALFDRPSVDTVKNAIKKYVLRSTLKKEKKIDIYHKF